MLDVQQLRDNLTEVTTKLAQRGYVLDSQRFTALEEARKAAQNSAEQLRSKRNSLSKQIGQYKAQGQDASSLLAEVGELGAQLDAANEKLEQVRSEYNDFLAYIPNIPDRTVPAGKSEEDNEFVRSWGDKPAFDFTPIDHVSIAEQLQGLDIAAAAKLSGARFAVLQGGVARLQRALAQFMLDKHTTHHGYTETYVPYMVKEQAMFGTGQLPKFRDDQFAVSPLDLWLIPTAEVPLTNIFADDILAANELPAKLCAHTPCFRAEAGSYGKDTRGLIRQHQFEKVELVQIVTAATAQQAHEELTGHAEAILQELQLPYQVVNLCGGDLGQSACKTYDLEVWLPSQQCYREISSCSWFADYQARRMQTRWRDPQHKKPQLVHTVNGSGVAVGRALVAVLENYQQADGSVIIPEVLQPYMGGASCLTASD